MLVVNHHDAGVFADQSALTMRASVVDDTSACEADGDGRLGILGTEAQLSLSGWIVRRSGMAGIVAEDSRLDADGCLVEDIRGGQIT